MCSVGSISVITKWKMLTRFNLTQARLDALINTRRFPTPSRTTNSSSNMWLLWRWSCQWPMQFWRLCWERMWRWDRLEGTGGWINLSPKKPILKIITFTKSDLKAQKKNLSGWMDSKNYMFPYCNRINNLINIINTSELDVALTSNLNPMTFSQYNPNSTGECSTH